MMSGERDNIAISTKRMGATMPIGQGEGQVQPNQDNTVGNDFRRYSVARIVLFMSGSILAILILLILFPWLPSDEARERLQYIANAVIPLIGTWVGTVITFYFTKENFDAANRSMQNVINNLTPQQRLQSKNVRDVMLSIDKATVVTLQQNQSDADIKLADLNAMLGQTITRIPILQYGGTKKYIIHNSIITKYFADNRADPNLDSKTLADMVGDAIIKETIEKIGVVGIAGTMADAKAAMEVIPGCQDVIVTENGQGDKPVLGFIMNTHVARCAEF